MLANKDIAGFLAPFADRIRALVAVPVPGHPCHAPDEIVAVARRLGIPAAGTAADVGAAVDVLECPAVLIAGSLYLAGEVLAANDEPPR